ncbi:MAG: OmpA family protein, partial [Candidatus Rokuibacteriota bacterium]
VELHGYTDPRGTERYNLELSRRRVEAVRRYLVQRGVELPRINSIGLGPIVDQGVAPATKRRVTVRMMLQAD